MKRLLVSLAFSALVSLAAAAATTGPRFGIDFALSPQVGILYGGNADVGFSGTALAIEPFYQRDVLRIEAGVEAGSSPIGWQVLAPLRLGARWPLAPFTIEALAEVTPGIVLFQQHPLFLIGAGALGRLVWNATPSFGIFAILGIRYTLCPAYVDSSGIDYSSLDLPLAVGVRWTFRAR
jgi:hypothetical protein